MLTIYFVYGQLPKKAGHSFCFYVRERIKAKVVPSPEIGGYRKFFIYSTRLIVHVPIYNYIGQK